MSARLAARARSVVTVPTNAVGLVNDGCDFDYYCMGALGFLGSGGVVDTESEVTFVTQFFPDDTLCEIRSIDVQGPERQGHPEP